MLFKEFCKKYGINVKDIDTRQSKSSYEGTETKIIYFRISPSVEGQDCLVLSRHAAEAVLDGTIKPANLQASQTEVGWGLIMPDTSQAISLDMSDF